MRDRLRLALASHAALELPLDGRVPAGVIALLQERGGIDHLVFQVRTHRVRHHKGQISFPGGRRDPGDASLLDTALRETHEEIGVPPDAIDVLGQLDDTLTSQSNYLVRPYVGAIPAEVDVFTAAPREVHEVLYVPLDHLLQPGALGWYPVERDGDAVATPAYRCGEHVIWGATARILGGLLWLLGAPPWPEELPAAGRVGGPA